MTAQANILLSNITIFHASITPYLIMIHVIKNAPNVNDIAKPTADPPSCIIFTRLNFFLICFDIILSYYS
ncbi:two-component sensor histidine kinase [Lactococcus lactis subsp. lactis IO-1]|nr:two-component sensor histidine kinase [Lactococcus lactis subsp. lactis IO-1]